MCHRNLRRGLGMGDGWFLCAVRRDRDSAIRFQRALWARLQADPRTAGVYATCLVVSGNTGPAYVYLVSSNWRELRR